MIDIYKYPFLRNLEEELRKYGNLKFSDILNSSIIELAKERLESIRRGDKKLRSYKEYGNKSILVFYTLVTIISLSQNERLKELFANVEAEHFIELLQHESEEVLLEFCNLLSIPIEKNSINLKIIKDNKSENLRLYNQILHKGKVYINKEKILEILKHMIAIKLKELIKPIVVSKELEEIKEKLGIRTRKITPPCMEEIRRKIDKNEELTEEEIKTYIVYLINIGYSKDSIRLIFQNRNIKNLENLIDNLRRKRYIVYSCTLMKKMGMCVSECNVRNPLQLYYS